MKHVLFAIVVILTTPALGQTPAHCLQQGLNDVAAAEKKESYNVGPVDGAPGGMTIAGASAYLADHPEADLPEITRSNARDFDTQVQWCFHLNPPTVMYGTAFKAIYRAADEEHILSSIGPHVLTWHDDATLVRIEGSWDLSRMPTMHGKLQPMSSSNQALPAQLLDEHEAVKALSPALKPMTDFFVKMARDQAEVYQVVQNYGNGAVRTDLFYVGEDGVTRVVVKYRDNSGEAPLTFYRVATAETWASLGEFDSAANWDELARLDFTVPEEPETTAKK